MKNKERTIYTVLLLLLLVAIIGQAIKIHELRYCANTWGTMYWQEVEKTMALELQLENYKLQYGLKKGVK